MSVELLEYYFCVCENGVVVFWIDIENCQCWIEMDQIVVVNIKNGEIKLYGDWMLLEEDFQIIKIWMGNCIVLLVKWDIDDIYCVVDYLNLIM